MKLFNILKNLASKCNKNLQEAKDYTDELVEFEDLSSQVISGTAQLTLNTSWVRCYRIGNLLYMTVEGTFTANQSQAVSLPLAYIPLKVDKILAGAGTINGSGYARINYTTESDGRQWLKQGWANTPTSGQILSVWAILHIAEGGQ